MIRRIARAARRHLDEIFEVVGLAAIVAGVDIAFGLAAGLVAFGLAAIALSLAIG